MGILLRSLLCALLLPLFLFSDECPEEEIECPDGPNSCHVDLRHLEYQGIGFDKGYTSFDLFLSNAEPWRENNIFFLDLRAHVFNDGKPAANTGFGWRYLFDSYCHALGLNTYYDYRKTKRKNYNQFGAGLEYLTPEWEFRANGYFPFGSHKSELFDLDFDHFAGNNFFVSRKHEFSMTGGDAEVGWHFIDWDNIHLFAGVGPYYFKGSLGDAAIGAKARIQARLTPYVTLEAGDSYDQVFHNRFHAELTLSFPFGPRSKSYSDKPCCPYRQNKLQQWIHDAPSRAEVIVVDTKKKTSAAIDPRNGLPFFLLFVDNTSHSNGTFESPFNTLVSAQTAAAPGNVIYVYPGDGTTNGMNAGIDLSLANTDNVRLLGSGVSHGFNTTLGFLLIPAQTAAFPSITSMAGPVVTLGINNEVAGFQIFGGTPSISGIWNGANTSTTIDRNQIFNSPAAAIQLIPTNTNLNALIDGNLIASPIGIGIDSGYLLNSSGIVTIQNNIIQFGSDRGIQMLHTNAAAVTSNIYNNFFNNLVNDSILVNVDGLTTTAVTQIVGNTFYLPFISPGPYGVHLLTNTSATHTSLIQNNIFDQTTFPYTYTILVETGNTTSASTTATAILSNTITGGGGAITLMTDPMSLGPFQAVVSDNILQNIYPQPRFSGSYAAINLYSFGLSPIQVEISRNTIDHVTGTSGIGFAIDGSSPMPGTEAPVNIDLVQNKFFNCSFSAIRCVTPTDMNIRFNVIENVAKLNGDLNGGSVTVDLEPSAGTWVIHFLKNTFTDSVFSNVFFAPSSPATMCVRINDNVIDDAIVLEGAAGTLNVENPTNNSNGYTISQPVNFVPAGTCE